MLVKNILIKTCNGWLLFFSISFLIAMSVLYLPVYALNHFKKDA